MSIRVRLTLLYAGAFFVAGAALVTFMHFFLGHALDRQLTARHGITEQIGNHLPADAQQAIQDQFEQDRAQTLHTMFAASVAALGVVGVGATGFGWLMAGRALRPLQQITATARRVADRSLHERIALQGPADELKDLADTFDEMLERLDHSFDSQRRFVANASHELRTPLTLNRTLIEVTLDDPEAHPSLRQLGTTLLAINQRHERLIDGLLTLASSEQSIAEPSTVDLADVARHVVGDKQVRTGLWPAPVMGDPVLLERLVTNLIDNATRYNLPEHGTVEVTTEVADDHAQLTVENTGPVIPAYDVPALFQPFRRLPASDRVASQGAGLGLSIVAAIAQAHGGEVRAQPRGGGGLVVRVRIPANRPTGARD